MKCWGHPPVTQCMQEHVVRVTALVMVELIEQTMTIMLLTGILNDRQVGRQTDR